MTEKPKKDDGGPAFCGAYDVEPVREKAERFAERINAALLPWLQARGWVGPEKAEAYEIALAFKNSAIRELEKERDAWKLMADGLFTALHRIHHAVEFFQEDTYQNEGPDAQDMIQAKEALAAYSKMGGTK